MLLLFFAGDYTEPTDTSLLTVMSEGTETLAVMSEGTETISLMSESTDLVLTVMTEFEG